MAEVARLNVSKGDLTVKFKFYLRAINVDAIGSAMTYGLIMYLGNIILKRLADYRRRCPGGGTAKTAISLLISG